MSQSAGLGRYTLAVGRRRAGGHLSRKRRRPTKIVLDTNVVLSALSIHDMTNANKTDTDQHLKWRVQQARDALVFLCYCHRHRVVTMSLKEVAETAIKRVPPGVPSLERNYIDTFIDFLRPDVLKRWKFKRLSDFDDLGGNAADDALLRVAQEHRCWLVTNEGQTESGIDIKKGSLRKKAMDAGVSVGSADEYLAHRRANRQALAHAFVQRVDLRKQDYIERHREKFPNDDVENWMLAVQHTHDRILAPLLFTPLNPAAK